MHTYSVVRPPSVFANIGWHVANLKKKNELTRTKHAHTGTGYEARLAAARLGNLNMGVLRDHHGRGGRQHDPGTHPQSTMMTDKEKRRTLLHYFIFQPPDEESERGGLGCGASGENTGGWVVPCWTTAVWKPSHQKKQLETLVSENKEKRARSCSRTELCYGWRYSTPSVDRYAYLDSSWYN